MAVEMDPWSERLARKFAAQEEIRSAVDLRWLDGVSPAIPDGYGRPGAGNWAAGMVWQSPYATYSGGTDGALRLSAVFGCLRLLSEAISTLPLDTFTRSGGIRKPFRPRPEYLNFQPPQGSRINYLSQVMLSLLTDGNAFVVTVRDELGVPVELFVIDPTLVEVKRKRGVIVFVVDDKEYNQFDIMHIPGMMLPGGVRGVSPLAAARDVIDGGRRAQDFGRTFMGNSAVPPAVIEVPEGGSGDPVKERDRAKRIAETWNETHGGTSNAGKVGVLTGGAKLTTIAISPEDAEWLDSKRFGVSEIARFYGVPPHLIADASNSTSWGSGLAEQNLAFGQFSLRPWTERIEDGHGRLLTTHGLPDVFMKLNLDALLRASLKDRYDAYAIGVGNDIDTINECRLLEDKPPVPWGDERPSSLKQPPIPEPPTPEA